MRARGVLRRASEAKRKTAGCSGVQRVEALPDCGWSAARLHELLRPSTNSIG